MSEQQISFPISCDSSILFAAKNAFITRAQLIANGTVLGVVTPVYDPRPKVAPETKLPFLGDRPFHAALCAKWDVKVVLSYTEGLPSLIMYPQDTTITWDDVPSDAYEDTILQEDYINGPYRTLIYLPVGGGYRRAQ